MAALIPFYFSVFQGKDYENGTVSNDYEEIVRNNPRETDSLLTNSNQIVGYTNNNEKIFRQEIKIYRRRWYMLFLYSFTLILLGVSINTWGPIESSARAVFGWQKGSISLLGNWSNIASILMIFLASWIVDSKGILLFFCEINHLLFALT